MVQKRILPVAITAITLLSLLALNCTKLDTTDIGSDLLPAVDNVHTFETFLDINSTQGIFTDDSTKVSRGDDFALGYIGFDPLFGKTTANIYMQLKPPFYPYSFGSNGDTITGPGLGLDSIVLCLKYAGFWGDKMLPVNIEVREVNDMGFRDSVANDKTVNYQAATGALLATASVNVNKIFDTIKYKNQRDFSVGLIRVKLPASWATSLFNRDSVAANTSNNAFYKDSAYRYFYNGLAVKATGGNGLMYINLADTATKLEIHYKRKKQGATVIDSVYSAFRLNATSAASAANAPISNAANHIVRNRAGSPMLTPAPGEHYLQTSPGSFVNLDIPGLSTLSNRIIHRAEIIVEQIPTDPIYDTIFYAPNYLYIDLKDTTTATNRWKPIYFDLNPNVTYDPDYKTSIFYYPPGNQVDFAYFGGYKRNRIDRFGNPISYYNFNITRYLQHLVTRHNPNYQIRLYAPFNISYPQYSSFPLSYPNNIALGRVKIGSGTNPNYKLRLRIIYSNL